MTAPKAVSDDFFVETNFCATDLIKKIKMILSMCEISYDDLKIVYEKKPGTEKSPNIVDSVSHTDAYESKFYTYLKSVAKLADKTCASYVSAIRSAECYAIDNNYKFCSLFNENNDKMCIRDRVLPSLM